ncbi:MAG: SMP-30/gluconolactonase/LRE family protein [Parvularculaceae bacterium]|nr:SMP-30/gluconolactonase/LRE family protein [Parvularculaceae bacterium]
MTFSQIAITSIRCVANVHAVLGEGPLWDERIGRLIFLDIKGEKLFLYDPDNGSTQTLDAPGMISALALATDGYVCAFQNGFARLSIDESRIELMKIADPEPDIPGNRFNDGKIDPDGAFWAGSMDNAEKDADAGAWWRLGRDGEVRKIDAGYHVTNGPAFDHERGLVYLTDSARQIVYRAKFVDGKLADKSAFLRFCDGDGYPDGMEVDAEGALWIAFWDGGAIRRFSPEGEWLQEVALPVPRPTSLAFVDRRIYVTSARVGLSEEAIARAPASGGLFEICADTVFSRPNLPNLFRI